MPARRSRGNQRGGDEKVEVGHPPVEYRARLIVEVDCQGEDHALPDQEGHQVVNVIQAKSLNI